MEIKKVYTNITITDPLIEPFYIVKDPYCYTLYERMGENKDRKEYGKILGHYVTLGMIFKVLAQSKLHLKSKYNSIKEYLEYYKNINLELQELLKKIEL